MASADSVTDKIFQAALLPEHKKYPPNYDGYAVIGAGLPRTGTMSMQAALEKLLNGPCYHMLQVAEGTDDDLDHWEKILNDQNISDKEWKQFLEGRGFRSGVDYPISHHFETLMRVFPNAKVVLTVRDPEKWYLSVKTTIYNARNFVHGTIGLFLKLVGQHRRITIVTSTSQQGPPVTKRGMFDTIGYGKEESIKFYNDWVSHVKKVVPSNRLLVFEAKQGWGPLCKFLDLPVPDGKFPHVNDTPAMLANFKKMKMAAYFVIWVIPILIALLFSYALFF